MTEHEDEMPLDDEGRDEPEEIETPDRHWRALHPARKPPPDGENDPED